MEKSVDLGFGLSDLYIPPVPAPPNETDKRQADPAFRKFRDDVYATLHSQIQGFPDLCELMRCYNSDTGNDPFEIARKFGFRSFNDFLTSDEMKEYVTITKSQWGQPSFHAAERNAFDHIRKEQVESFQNNCIRRARREGFCDTQRMRPKLLEVAKINQWSAGFCAKHSEDAKQPDVLTRPGPAAASIRRNTSMWGNKTGGVDYNNDDYDEDWTEKLTTNVERIGPKPSTICELDWGYEELAEEASQSTDFPRTCAKMKLDDDENFGSTPISDSQRNVKTINWCDDDNFDDFKQEKSRNTSRKHVTFYDELIADENSRAVPIFDVPQSSKTINWCADDDSDLTKRGNTRDSNTRIKSEQRIFSFVD